MWIVNFVRIGSRVLSRTLCDMEELVYFSNEARINRVPVLLNIELGEML